ncbi:MAG: dihydroorotate dehydrogenase [bacterium]|nr:dihydroorotate dehydrogenase [bacterium]
MDLKTKLGNIELQNPLIAASGTFGYGFEIKDIINIEELGAVTTKTITLHPRLGNPLPRILETPAGLLNSIGLQNPGLKAFKKNIILPWEKIKNVKMFVSVGGNDISEYIQVIAELDQYSRIDAFELNISCPNVKKGCLAIGSNPILIEQLITQAKSQTKKPIIVKISPNFSNIIETAKITETAGADILSMVNTFLGTKIDIKTKDFYFKNKVAGLSGPAIKPLALKLLVDVAEQVKLPIIGMGGISNTEDVLEFLIAGASAVSIGTMNFRNPKILLALANEMKKQDINVNEIIGSLFNRKKNKTLIL